MASFRCSLIVSPEVREELNDRLIRSEWKLVSTPEEEAAGTLVIEGQASNDVEAAQAMEELLPDRAPMVVRALGISPIGDLSGLASTFAQLNPIILVQPIDPPAEDPPVPEPQPSPEQPSTNGKEVQATDAKARSDLAQSIDAGLAALTVPASALGYLHATDRHALVAQIVEAIYKDRSAYARTVRWSFSPEAELWGQISGFSRPGLAHQILKSRAGIAPHQLKVADEVVNLHKQSVAQQAAVVDMLREFLNHLKKWTSLAETGRRMLWVTLVTGLLALGVMLFLTWDEKIADWALPLALAGLAVFIISPAVLLIVGRPLAGLDAWNPTGADRPDSEEDSEDSDDAGGGTPSPVARTISYGQTNQPKAYGPHGSLRT